MLRLIGAAMLGFSFAGVGCALAHSVRSEIALARELLLTVSVLRSETGFGCALLPDVLNRAEKLCAHLSPLLHVMAERLRSEPGTDLTEVFPELLSSSGCRLPSSCRGSLSELLPFLGIADAEAQAAALELAGERIRQYLAIAERECGLRCRRYRLTAVCIGTVLTILLL